MVTKPEKIRDGLYVKKNFDGYRVVYPIKKDIDATPKPFSSAWCKNINWFNLVTGGNWWKVIKVSFLIFIILFSVWAYKRDTEFCQNLEQDICRKLGELTVICSESKVDVWMLNVSKLNISMSKQAILDGGG